LVLDLPEGDERGLHWTTRPIVEWAADRSWVASRHRGPALLHTVEASTGLTGHDLTAIATWRASVA
jgi:hypothetical protein